MNLQSPPYIPSYALRAAAQNSANLGAALDPRLDVRDAAPNKPTSLLLSSIEALEKELDGLNGILGALTDRLQPVLAETAPTAEDGRTSPVPPCSYAVNEINRVASRVSYMRQCLDVVLSRLEL